MPDAPCWKITPWPGAAGWSCTQASTVTFAVVSAGDAATVATTPSFPNAALCPVDPSVSGAAGPVCSIAAAAPASPSVPVCVVASAAGVAAPTSSSRNPYAPVAAPEPDTVSVYDPAERFSRSDALPVPVASELLNVPAFTVAPFPAVKVQVTSPRFAKLSNTAPVGCASVKP